MELPVFFQAEQAALAALLGVLLAALYDLLRALRRVLPGAAGFADGLFALVFFLSMLAFALYPGQGVFRRLNEPQKRITAERSHEHQHRGCGSGRWLRRSDPAPSGSREDHRRDDPRADVSRGGMSYYGS